MQQTSQRRGDIQGLRAWAVIFVLIGHIASTAFPGGFIGVDIFFVISGFVITQQMIQLRETFPKSFLLNFYSRRIRRILPSALLVLFVTFFATQHYLGVVAANDFKQGAGWVSIFLGNFFFQKESLNYFSAGVITQPIQHFWSLSIEEQFYLFWPALFLILSIFRRLNLSKFIVLAMLIISSLTFALYSTEIEHRSIFFNTFTRVWELAIGAYLAFIPTKWKRSGFIEFASFLALLLCALKINASMQWPRLTTIPVVLLTAYLLHSVQPSKFSFLTLPPIRYLGDISYLIYLWHWPILNIVKNIRPNYDASSISIIIGLTLILSILTHHLFEEPIRRSELLLKRPVVTLASTLAIITLTSTYFFQSYIR